MTRLTQSYTQGASAVPLIGDTIGAHFDKAVERWADRPALIVTQQNIRWTYAELNARVDAFAAGLLALGLAPGDRVGIWSPNNAEWVVTQFATAKAGLILVNINPAYRTFEVDYRAAAEFQVAAHANVMALQRRRLDACGGERAAEAAQNGHGEVACKAPPEVHVDRGAALAHRLDFTLDQHEPALFHPEPAVILGSQRGESWIGPQALVRRAGLPLDG